MEETAFRQKKAELEDLEWDADKARLCALPSCAEQPDDMSSSAGVGGMPLHNCAERRVKTEALYEGLDLLRTIKHQRPSAVFQGPRWAR